MKDLTLKRVREMEDAFLGDGSSLAVALRMLRERMEKERRYSVAQNNGAWRVSGPDGFSAHGLQNGAFSEKSCQRIADALNAFEAQP